MKKLLFGMAVLWIGGAALWYHNENRETTVGYRTVPVARGDLLATINATGTLEPEGLVEVNAQVAGVIESFGEDPGDSTRTIGFGSRVERGTVLARIVADLFKTRVDQSKAGVLRAEAEVGQAEAKLRQTDREIDRSRKLQTKGYVPPAEHDTALANHETAISSLALSRSAVALAKANLAEAEVNLANTTIKSPVKGVILDRRVNIGQSVGASATAPNLFLIAKDYSRIEIWASVNETDIGAIRVGQGVKFTVASFPNDSFRGTVAQVRLNASMTQSVVTYTVVVEVDNSTGKLLPYLTARLQFEVDGRDGVLLVPNAALRWKPKVNQVAPPHREEYARAHRSRAAEAADPARSAAGEPTRAATLWVRAGEFVRPVPVKIGLTDGSRTEVAAGGDLIEGSAVVIGQAQASDEPGGTASPFLPKIKNEKAKR